MTILLILALLFGGPLGFGMASWDVTPNRFTKNDYSNIMRDNVTGNPRVVDIAMLGAHDALSGKIRANSPLDPNSRDITILRDNAWAKFFGSGVGARAARAQKSSAYDLARHGVRFFDMRVSLVDGTWYATHGFIAQPLDECLRELIRFMDGTHGEVLVLSFYEVLGGYARDLLDYLPTVAEQGKTLLDFVRYDASAAPLGELCYNDVAQGGSGAVILLTRSAKTYYREVYSYWHDTNDPEELLQGIEEENEWLAEYMDWYADEFRWNQAQLTAQFGWPELLRIVPDWSLLNMAHKFNYRLLGGLPDWLPQMPILGVDYADDMKNGFNDKAIEGINAYNRSLT